MDCNGIVSDLCKMKFVRYIAVLFLILDSCIQPFNLNVNTQNAIVVDGLISDQPGPYNVKLFQTLGLEDQLGAIQWVEGAKVSIFDELGTETVLKEQAPGNYQTDSAFLGIVGKTYQLKFSTGDGQVYESAPEKMLPVGDLDSVYHEFIQKEPPPEYGDPLNGFNIL